LRRKKQTLSLKEAHMRRLGSNGTMIRCKAHFPGPKADDGSYFSTLEGPYSFCKT
jgi:hypothetical protein